jgi:hypothetical protein
MRDSAGACALLLLLAPGCSTFEGLELAKAECESVLPPLRPSSSSASTEDLDIAMAFRGFDFGEKNRDGGPPPYQEIGFDLDGLCTGQGEGPGCAQPALSSLDPTDSPGGRDNAAGGRFFGLEQTRPFLSWPAFVRENAEAGALSIVLRVRGYNGGVDDEVEVAIYAGRLRAAAQQVGQDGSSSTLPAWDGTDEWLVFDEWINLTEGPTGEFPARYRVTDAYVTEDQILVAHFPNVLTGIGLLLHAVVSGRLVRTKAGWTLVEATMAGRQSLDNTLEFFVQGGFAGVPVCVGGLYEALRLEVCSYADVSSTLSNDPALPCDATSIAWNFEAEPVKLAGTDDWAAFTSARAVACPPAMSPPDDGCSNP